MVGLIAGLVFLFALLLGFFFLSFLPDGILFFIGHIAAFKDLFLFLMLLFFRHYFFYLLTERIVLFGFYFLREKFLPVVALVDLLGLGDQVLVGEDAPETLGIGKIPQKPQQELIVRQLVYSYKQEYAQGKDACGNIYPARKR